jgi:xylulokinase
MMDQLFLGIDSSTQGCKVIVINAISGSIDYTDSINYDQDLPHFGTRQGVIPSVKSGISEAPPEMWLEAIQLLFDRMVEKRYPLQKIKAISVSGQQHGLVTLDRQGNLTRSTGKLWNDTSTFEECEILTREMGGKEEMIREIGNSQRPGYTAGKIFNIYRNEPEIAEKTNTFFLVHNYVNWYLTGGIRIMEPGDVSGMALSFPGKNEWSDKICSIISPDLVMKLPPVKPSDEMIGKISPQLVERYSFSPECYIDAGSGDNMYGAIGTGNITPGIVTISLGTSGTAYTIFEEPYIDPKGEIALFCDSTGRYLSLLCVSNMANGYVNLLEQHNLTHNTFEELLNQTPPGNQGKLLFPWFTSERTPDLPFASPIYWGFSLNEFTTPLLCRAVLEGHILNLFDGFSRMPVETAEIRITGGLSNSDAWCQAIADIFEVVTVPVQGEGAALGAAIHAAWVYQKKSDPDLTLDEIVAKFVRLNEKRRKIPRHSEVYRPIKEAYSEIIARIQQQIGSMDPFKILYLK